MPVVFCIAVFKTLSYSCFVKIFTLLQVCKVPFALKFQILTVLFYLNSIYNAMELHIINPINIPLLASLSVCLSAACVT